MLEKSSLVPYVVEQTSKGERSYDIFSRLLKEISESSASFFSIVSESFFEKASVSL